MGTPYQPGFLATNAREGIYGEQQQLLLSQQQPLYRDADIGYQKRRAGPVGGKKNTTKMMVTCGLVALGLVATGIAVAVMYRHTYIEFSWGRTVNGQRKGNRRGIGRVITLGGAPRLAFDQEVVVYSIGDGVSSLDNRAFAQPVRDEHLFGLINERHIHAHGEMANGSPMNGTVPAPVVGGSAGVVAPLVGAPVPTSNPTTVKSSNPFIGNAMPDMAPIDAYVASKRTGVGF